MEVKTGHVYLQDQPALVIFKVVGQYGSDRNYMEAEVFRVNQGFTFRTYVPKFSEAKELDPSAWDKMKKLQSMYLVSLKDLIEQQK